MILSKLLLIASSSSFLFGFASSIILSDSKNNNHSNDPVFSVVNPKEFEQSLEDHESSLLADLTFENGVKVSFTYHELTKSYGMEQNGRNDVSEPLIRGGVKSILKAFLDITPSTVPVPELLIAEMQDEPETFLRFAKRKRSKETVVEENLKLPPKIETSESEDEEELKDEHKLTATCNVYYLSWYDWHDAGYSGMTPDCYVSSYKYKYAQSFIYNCTPKGSPKSLYARHGMYYYYNNNWYLNFYVDAKPGYWSLAESKTSTKAYHGVCYDDGWKNKKSCGYGCKYTREGRFFNS